MNKLYSHQGTLTQHFLENIIRNKKTFVKHLKEKNEEKSNK